MSNWTDPPPKRERHPTDPEVTAVALRLLANSRIIDIMPHAAGYGSCDLLRERARVLAEEGIMIVMTDE